MSEKKKSRYTEAQARAASKYLKESVEDIRIRVPKGQKAVIKEYADSQGESMNAFVLRAIDERMTADKTPDTGAHMDPSAHPEAAPSPSGSTNQLPPDTWTAAEAGSSYTGETVTEFIDRAISEQTRRDDVSRRLGVNPITGERLEPKGE